VLRPQFLGTAVTIHSFQSETISRGARMLRTAFGPAIARYLEDPAIIEVMLNPDGRLWIDRLSGGLSETNERLSAPDGERIVRLVAHHVGAEVHADSPRVSAELPETGERFEGLLPPVVAAPAFAIRTLAAVLGLGLRLWIAGLLIGVIGQAAAVWAAKRDPQFVDVVRRHLRISGYLGI
jgi:type IV secretion system protein TrbB